MTPEMREQLLEFCAAHPTDPQGNQSWGEVGPLSPTIHVHANSVYYEVVDFDDLDLGTFRICSGTKIDPLVLIQCAEECLAKMTIEALRSLS